MSAINDQFITYRKNPSVVCTEIYDGAVLLDLDTKYYYNLNETGLRIWHIMEESQNLAEVAEKLSIEYAVEEERAKASVAKLVEDLEKEGLIMPDGKDN